MIPLVLPEVQAVILTGGKSERMGSPKALLPFRGNLFIAHLLSALQPQVNAIALSGEPEGVSLRDLGVPVIEDTSGDGPLMAVAQALRASHKSWLLVVPCDNPLLPADFAQRMLYGARQLQTQAIYVEKEGVAQPLYALLHRELLPSLEAFLASGQRKIMDWYAAVNARPLSWTTPTQAFDNINTPEEYQAFIERDRV